MAGTTGDNGGQFQVSRIVLIFKRIAYSREPIMLALRCYLVIGAAVWGIRTIRIWLLSLSFPYIFRKDFIQDFLVSKAVLSGVDPYLPGNKLADLFLGPLPSRVFQHPSPHPPPVALFCLPLGLLSYQHAAILWFLFELVCLFSSVVLLLRYLEVQKRVTVASLSALLILTWLPIEAELVMGQWTAFLLLLLVGTWRALLSRKDFQGGILLGSAIAVKLIPWPILIFLMVRKNWRTAFTAITTISIANVAAAMLMGIDRTAQYYLKVGTSVLQTYHASIGNFSLWTIGWRMLDGTTLKDWGGPNVPPLFAAPALAPFISIAIPFALLIFGIILAFKARTIDTSFGILICVIILVSPVAWSYYPILALIPLILVLRNLSSLNWPRKETNIAIFIGITFSLSAREMMPLLIDNRIPDALVPTVSFTVALLSILPAVGLLALIWLVRRIR